MDYTAQISLYFELSAFWVNRVEADLCLMGLEQHEGEYMNEFSFRGKTD